MMKLTYLVLVSLVLTAGCITKPRFFQTQSERDEIEQQSPAYKAKQAAIEQKHADSLKAYFDAYPNLRPDIVKAIKEQRIVLGMNENQVILSWDIPSKMNKTVGGFGEWDQWVYDDRGY